MSTPLRPPRTGRTAQALHQALDAVVERFGHSYRYTSADFNAPACWYTPRGARTCGCLFGEALRNGGDFGLTSTEQKYLESTADSITQVLEMLAFEGVASIGTTRAQQSQDRGMCWGDVVGGLRHAVAMAGGRW